MSDSNVSRSVTPATAGSSSPPPLPSALQQLKAALSGKTDKAVLEHCLGLIKLEGVDSLADCMIVVCFDTEGWVHDHNRITEIGVSTFDSRDMRAVKKPGLHGENLLDKIYFYHAPIQEDAHLINIMFCVGNPDSNRFGQTRFVTKEQASLMMADIFCWPIEESKPELGFCPVVLVGHALDNDLRKLRNTLGFSATSLDTVVKVIDTQDLARTASNWNGNNPIGLAKLVPRCGFDYRDPHTASNDAAMTLICAIQMVLPADLKSPEDHSLQHIVNELEIASQRQTWTWGTDKYCIRCGGYGHTKDNYRGRRCFVKVKCHHCAESQLEKRRTAARTHRTEGCISYAKSGREDLQGPIDEFAISLFDTD